MVYFYQEFTTGPESITHGASGRKDRRVSVDKLWTRPSTDAHTRETHACMQTCPAHGHEYPSTPKVVCVRVLAGSMKWQRSQYRGPWGKRKEKVSCWMNIRQDKTWKHFSGKCRQKLKSFITAGDTLSALLASWFPALLENELVLVALQSNHSSATRKAFNDCLSQSGNRGNEIL